ncbi:undecaprenyl/decaprenyl-phosphate alpha-N-acetylglucosaminyl 1-phosphate transferase [Patescibacteria group bacterium]|nr:MAG: undecaprenyl/decaprenyl-phosphate alpha-N-acetylglucosaminyl 1-phosphate transferase [Patescibacteria group bacterium]
MDATFGMFLLAGSAAAFLGALLLTPAVAALARGTGAVDHPAGERKKHGRDVPLLGGIAIFAPLVVVLLVFVEQGVFNGVLFNPAIPTRSIIGLILGGAILMIGGWLDDRYNLKPAVQFLFPVAAALTAVACGIHIPYVRSPFGGDILSFEAARIALPFGSILFPADPLTVLWLLLLMYTTKFLDGLDGLVTGLTGIAAVVMFFVALRPEVGQTATAILALVIAGAFLGFLPWNWSPAKVFLGEGGSLFAGYAIGILAVISGSKVATTLLVLGIPLLDLIGVILQRVAQRLPPTRGDRRHLHFRLVDAGLPVPTAVLSLYAIALVFGLIGLFAQTRTKAAAFVVLIILMASMAASLYHGVRHKH